jgi:hypothetical protein
MYQWTGIRWIPDLEHKNGTYRTPRKVIKTDVNV